MAETSVDRDENGLFLPGNRFWEARSSHGRKPIFATADDLWTACLEYFEWNAENPLYEAKAFSYEGNVTVQAMPKMRAMTITGLCIFLDIDQVTWRNQAGRGPDFLTVTTRAEQIIRSQKFEGAAADLLNANIIARDLGLADKSEITGKDGGPIETKSLTDLETARRIAFLLTNATP